MGAEGAGELKVRERIDSSSDWIDRKRIGRQGVCDLLDDSGSLTRAGFVHLFVFALRFSNKGRDP